MTVTIASTTQYFFAWRVARLTGRSWIGWSIAGTTFIQFLAGAATSAAAWIIVDFSRFGEVKLPIIVWLTTSAIADVLITCVLSWYLHSHRTGFPRTDHVITRIIQLTIQTGLMTSLWATIDLILYLTLDNNLHLLFNLPLCKLYTNSLMSTLNSRGGWGSDLSASVVIGTPNGISVNITTISELDKGTDQDNSRREEPDERLARVPRRTHDSFELDEYTKPRSVDLEEGESQGYPACSTTGTFAAMASSQAASRQIEITQLHLSPRGTRACRSDEWSINSHSGRYNTK
ncbi:hypothetical protein FRC08_011956 [Ceratobasidium sp. 394]|nr:hypothetical protein FRC08_011956 [Ceratobasidium sp. 394]